MEPFTTLTAVAAPLLRINIDTDQIIPSREMKKVSKEGLGEGLFAGERYLEGSRAPNPDFVLNQPACKGARILLAGDNFGCGSSREHAVWALKDYGIRAVIAPSFGAIFYNNCIRNGILPVRLSDDAVRALAVFVAVDPQTNTLTVDLETCTLTGADTLSFEIGETDRNMLLGGLDPIDLTLQHDADIRAFAERDRLDRPWIYI